jgi:hypothetical protein
MPRKPKLKASPNRIKLTMEQAYRAMIYFLEQEYQRTRADEIGGLLGSLSWKTFLGRSPADPGAWVDWEQAVNAALSIPDDASPS